MGESVHRRQTRQSGDTASPDGGELLLCPHVGAPGGLGSSATDADGPERRRLVDGQGVRNTFQGAQRSGVAAMRRFLRYREDFVIAAKLIIVLRDKTKRVMEEQSST